MNFSDNYFEMMALRMQSAFRAMTDLERGAIANPDGNRKETRNGMLEARAAFGRAGLKFWAARSGNYRRRE